MAKKKRRIPWDTMHEDFSGDEWERRNQPGSKSRIPAKHLDMDTADACDEIDSNMRNKPARLGEGFDRYLNYNTLRVDIAYYESGEDC